MTKLGHVVALLSGELTVEQRAHVIGRFRRGIEKVLITTNVSARGTCLLTSCCYFVVVVVLVMVLVASVILVVVTVVGNLWPK